MTALKKAIVKSYDAAAHKATVQIAGSLGVWLDAVRVATDIPAADVVAGRQCTVLFLDPSNQDDAVVITIQGALPSGGAAPLSHAPIGALYPGVLSTGLQTPRVEYRGDGFTPSGISAIVDIPSAGASIKAKIYRNGTAMQKSGAAAEIEIAIGAYAGEVTGMSEAVADKDQFKLYITQVGTTPNEGSDLHWSVVP